MRSGQARASRGSPLNFAVGVVLTLAGVALLPLWRPVGPAGVPAGTLSYAPQGIAANLRARAPGTRVWQPQIWGSWLELTAPAATYVADSRVELFPSEVWADVSQVSTGSGDWLGVLATNNVDVLVLTTAQAARLEPALGATPGWTRSYADADGSIWIRLRK